MGALSPPWPTLRNRLSDITIVDVEFGLGERWMEGLGYADDRGGTCRGTARTAGPAAKRQRTCSRPTVGETFHDRRGGDESCDRRGHGVGFCSPAVSANAHVNSSPQRDHCCLDEAGPLRRQLRLARAPRARGS